MVSDTNELGQLLLRRTQCLRSLATDPQSKRSLVDHLDIPRSTLDGIMRELEKANLVSRSNGKWHVTHLGQCSLQVHEQYRSQLDSLTNVSSVTDALPLDNPVPCDFLIGADVYEPDPAVPDDMIQILLESIDDATQIRGFTPIAISAHTKPIYTRATAGDNYNVELLVPTNVFKRLRTMYPNQSDDALSDPQVSLLCGPIPVSFGLWIADNRHTGIIVYADHGVLGLIINDTPEALTWAENQYERVRQDADPISLLDSFH
ncbi:helix-turn-helix transcriptional regulator [Halogeometricum borinquense]|uniref:helix-turn-helix transcriptional regulator n=1 Tax=Halogeometricum borinquense TaxID=60847 RepID=UPI003436A77D